MGVGLVVDLAGQDVAGAPRLLRRDAGEADPHPAPGFGREPGRFGLVQEPFEPRRTDAPGFVTGPDGVARVELRLPELPDTTQSLEAVIQGTLYDIGGRPAVREIALPVRHQPFAIGIRPRFGGDAVPEGATATFDVVAVGPDGAPLDRPSLSYELYEEEYDYAWFEADGHWDYRAQVKDKRVTGGTLAVAAEPPADGRAAFENGKVDAWVIWDPFQAAAEQHNPSALLILLYSYAGSRLIWQLDDNTLMMSELNLADNKLQQQIAELGLKLDPADYRRELLNQF